MSAGLRRIVVTIDLEDDPLIEVLAVQALLRLVEWLHHEGTVSARTPSRSPPTDRRHNADNRDQRSQRAPIPSPCNASSPCSSSVSGNSHFADYQLRINGLVDNPVDLDLAQLRAFPHHEQITQHFCIQGWSGVAKWGGVSMQTIVDLVKPHPEAKWVVFYSLGEGADKGVYYDAHPIEHMSHHLTMLAYDMNDEPLSFGHGAPLRLRNEIELGFKQVKWIKGIEFVANYSEIGSGYGGYNQDHEFFGGSRSSGQAPPGTA